MATAAVWFITAQQVCTTVMNVSSISGQMFASSMLVHLYNCFSWKTHVKVMLPDCRLQLNFIDFLREHKLNHRSILSTTSAPAGAVEAEKSRRTDNKTSISSCCIPQTCCKNIVCPRFYFILQTHWNGMETWKSCFPPQNQACFSYNANNILRLRTKTE